jgi:hypothetical protein
LWCSFFIRIRTVMAREFFYELPQPWISFLHKRYRRCGGRDLRDVNKASRSPCLRPIAADLVDLGESKPHSAAQKTKVGPDCRQRAPARCRSRFIEPTAPIAKAVQELIHILQASRLFTSPWPVTKHCRRCR